MLPYTHKGGGAGACESQMTTFERQFFLSINVGPGHLTQDVRIGKYRYQLSYLPALICISDIVAIKQEQKITSQDKDVVQ